MGASEVDNELALTLYFWIIFASIGKLIKCSTSILYYYDLNKLLIKHNKANLILGKSRKGNWYH